jgi:predicted aminopeptidase
VPTRRRRCPPGSLIGSRLLVASLALLALTTLPGCYYGHLAIGQAKLLMARRSVDDVLADPETPTSVREQLELVQLARAYANDLGLEVEGQYTSYVDWPDDRIITSLVVTEPGSVEPRPFRFPIVGSAPYKGYFDEERARREADRLREKGLDVCLHAIPAYSTLGWFDDPLTTPMLDGTPGRLVETVLHELVHATVFVKSQPDFNEGAASFVGQEASVRFYSDAAGGEAAPDAADRRRAEVRDGRRLAEALLEFREQVQALYDDPPGAEVAERRTTLEREGRIRLSELPLETRDAGSISERIRLNDACLALRGTYSRDLPRHAAVLDRLDGELPQFIERLRGVADSKDPRTDFFAEIDGMPATGEAAPATLASEDDDAELDESAEDDEGGF